VDPAGMPGTSNVRGCFRLTCGCSEARGWVGGGTSETMNELIAMIDYAINLSVVSLSSASLVQAEAVSRAPSS
jgi:hypothetical protein